MNFAILSNRCTMSKFLTERLGQSGLFEFLRGTNGEVVMRQQAMTFALGLASMMGLNYQSHLFFKRSFRALR